MHLSADSFAMAVSSSNFLLFEGLSRNKTSGIPSGQVTVLSGLGGNLTPGMGRSLAREKEEQFGAQ